MNIEGIYLRLEIFSTTIYSIKDLKNKHRSSEDTMSKIIATHILRNINETFIAIFVAYHYDISFIIIMAKTST